MSYTNNRDIRSFPAAVAVGGYLIVKAAGDANKVRAGAANNEKLLGVSERVGARAGEMLDVTVSGETEVRAGGDMVFDDPITSDAAGRAIKAVPTAGRIVKVIGYLRSPGAALNDIVRIHVAPSFLPPPAA